MEKPLIILDFKEKDLLGIVDPRDCGTIGKAATDDQQGTLRRKQKLSLRPSPAAVSPCRVSGKQPLPRRKKALSQKAPLSAVSMPGQHQLYGTILQISGLIFGMVGEKHVHTALGAKAVQPTESRLGGSLESSLLLPEKAGAQATDHKVAYDGIVIVQKPRPRLGDPLAYAFAAPRLVIAQRTKGGSDRNSTSEKCHAVFHMSCIVNHVAAHKDQVGAKLPKLTQKRLWVAVVKIRHKSDPTGRPLGAH